MKKIFAIFAAALIAFGFSSCKKDDSAATGEAPEAISFKIEVSDVTAISAKVTITPSNEDMFYFCSCAPKASLEEFIAKNKMSTEDYVKEYLSYLVNTEGYSFGDVVQQGTQTFTLNSLKPTTEFVVFAVKINKNLELLSDLAKANFTTPELVIKQTIALAFDTAHYSWSYMASYKAGLLELTGHDVAKDIKMGLFLYASSANGKFTEDNCKDPYAAMGYLSNYISSASGVEQLLLVDVTGAFNADSSIYTYSGSVTTYGAVKYTFENVQADAPKTAEPEGEGEGGGEEATAPARKALASKNFSAIKFLKK